MRVHNIAQLLCLSVIILTFAGCSNARITSSVNSPAVESKESIDSSTTFTLQGVAANSVQTASHPILVKVADNVAKLVSSVHCGISWGASGSDESLVECQMDKSTGKIAVSLPQTVSQSKAGFATVSVKLMDASGGSSEAKTVKLYLSPSVAELSPCKAPDILSNPSRLLSSTALASTVGQSFDLSTLSTDIRIKVDLQNRPGVIDKHSLRTRYEKVSYNGSDYIVVYKAWPAFTAEHYGSGLTQEEKCKIAQEYKPRSSDKKLLRRFDAMVLAANGVMVGVNGDGTSQRLIGVYDHNLNGSDVNSVLGKGLSKIITADCSSVPLASEQGRAPAACVEMAD